jgi:HSP20 family molecular chaperone IbpA
MSAESRKTRREETTATPEMSPFHSSGWNVASACIEPLYNLTVGTNEVLLTIDLPYVNQNQVKLSCPENDIVELLAETIRKITFRDLGIKHRHGEFTCYHARIKMPVPVDESKMRAVFKRGVLEVRLWRLK